MARTPEKRVIAAFSWTHTMECIYKHNNDDFSTESEKESSLLPICHDRLVDS